MGRAGKDKVGQFDAVGGFVFDRSASWYLVDFPIMIFHIVLDGVWWCLGVFWLYLVASGKNRNKKGKICGVSFNCGNEKSIFHDVMLFNNHGSKQKII